MAAAPMGENYSGPILFEGEASPDDGRSPGPQSAYRAQAVAEPGMGGQAAVTELEGRRGVRIMPEFFDVTDDPTLPLFGHEEVDDEGVPEKPVSLVEKGVLKDFLRTREPGSRLQRIERPRALGGGGPTPTNLIIKAHETSSLSD
jgi:TldD protein